jgi:inhibitor of KinA
MEPFPRFRPIAAHAVLVEFGETIDVVVHQQVLRLDAALAAHRLGGFLEAVPAYASLLVAFDPIQTDHREVTEALGRLIETAPPLKRDEKRREIEVCYDDDVSPDLAEVARKTGLSGEQVVAAHLAGEYRVFMYGFAPGYAYLAGVPAPLQIPRKDVAIRNVPAGSVVIAGPQCLVTALTMPTGWWIIGRSPTRILSDDPARPFLLDVGDAVTFRRIDRAAFDAQQRLP